MPQRQTCADALQGCGRQSLASMKSVKSRIDGQGTTNGPRSAEASHAVSAFKLWCGLSKLDHAILGMEARVLRPVACSRCVGLEEAFTDRKM